MKEISFEEFKNRDYDSKGISNYKIYGECKKCEENFIYSAIKKFMRSRKNHPDKKSEWRRCQKCWLNLQTSDNPEWVEKNRKAQIVAQNKPEQKLKNAEGVSRHWRENPERKIKASNTLKRRWEEESGFKEKALNNLNWTQRKDDRYNTIMKKSLGTGGYKGIYKDMRYESALELSYIFWCEENSIEIKRFDLENIDYIDENGDQRQYIPDFIINDNTIVEIKGLGLYYQKNYQRNIQKIKYLKVWVEAKQMKMRLILSGDPILKKHYKKALKYHHETKKKNSI